MKSSSGLANLARQLKSMKMELVRMVREKAGSDLANKSEQGLSGIESLFNEIKKTKDAYDKMGGAFSLGYFKFAQEDMASNKLIKPSVIAMKNNGKVAVEQGDDWMKVFVLNDPRSEEVFERILRITGADREDFCKQELAVSDLMGPQKNCSYEPS